MNTSPLTPHVVAPVSSLEMCRAAVHNGAAEIYVGVPGFNARPRSHDLDLKALDGITRFAHLHGVKVSFAFNVLIFEDEIERALGLLYDLLLLEPDAFIVQDIGLVRIIRAAAPTMPVHASTQMTVSSSAGTEAMSSLGISRFILARELSLGELRKIKSKAGTELEVFVHGALCLSFSGQCFSSLFQGGRSANRGECAQPCRLPHKAWLDGKRHSEDVPYPLSLTDLSSREIVPGLLGIGISHFKIEGRLKEPEYVAAAVRAYSKIYTPQDPSLAITFSRRSGHGWLKAEDYLELSCSDYPGHRGMPVGVIKEVSSSSISVETDYSLQPGDGLLFLGGTEHRGARVYQVERAGGTLTLRFANAFSLDGLREGTVVYVNSSPSTEKRLRESYSSREKVFRIPLRAIVYGAVGEPLVLKYEDQQGHSGSAASKEPLAAAKTAPVSDEALRSELCALSGTPYTLRSVENHLEGAVFIQTRQLRRLRQQAIEALNENRMLRVSLEVRDRSEVLQSLEQITGPKKPPHSYRARVLVRRIEQIEAAAAAGVEEIYLEMDRLEKLQEAKTEALRLKRKVGLALPRIVKEGEEADLVKLTGGDWDFFLVRNLGTFQLLRATGIEMVGDFSLNAANHLSLDWLLSIGFQSVSPALDLDESRLRFLAEKSYPGNFEIPIYFYVPAFHTQFCFYSATCANGARHPDCKSPCLRHALELVSVHGLELGQAERETRYRVLTDSLCRNTLFFQSPEDRRHLLRSLLGRSGARFRMEMLNETVEETRKVIEETMKLTE